MHLQPAPRFDPRGAGRAPSAPNSDVESLLVFPSEQQAAPEQTPRRNRLAPGVAIAAVLCVVAFLLEQFLRPGAPTAVVPGEVAVTTRPAGADVLIDGQHRGVTPLELSLSPGAHSLVVRAAGDERAVPLTVVSGSAVAQYFEMNAAAPPPEPAARPVVAPPARARAYVDVRSRGVPPRAVRAPAVAERRVPVARETPSATRVSAGGTAPVAVSPAIETGPVGGWLTVTAPFDVQVREGSDIVGSSQMSRIMLAVGWHDVILASPSLGYEAPMRVNIGPGRVTGLLVDPPTAKVSLNARPWADVFIDSASAGQTPIANLTLAIGTHQVVFRHPQLGERRQSVVVSVRGPNRVSVDLTRPEEATP